MPKTTKQYLLKVQFACDAEEDKWWNGTRLDPLGGYRKDYYKTERDARAALERILAKANRDHTYDSKGQRRETHEIGGGFAADLIVDRRIDDMNRIVAWKIKVREVTPWEDVDSSET